MMDNDIRTVLVSTSDLHLDIFLSVYKHYKTSFFLKNGSKFYKTLLFAHFALISCPVNCWCTLMWSEGKKECWREMFDCLLFFKKKLTILKKVLRGDCAWKWVKETKLGRWEENWHIQSRARLKEDASPWKRWSVWSSSWQTPLMISKYCSCVLDQCYPQVRKSRECSLKGSQCSAKRS